MIHNDRELKVTHDRIMYFEGLLAQMRIGAAPENFAAMASGYRVEVEGIAKGSPRLLDATRESAVVGRGRLTCKSGKECDFFALE